MLQELEDKRLQLEEESAVQLPLVTDAMHKNYEKLHDEELKLTDADKLRLLDKFECLRALSEHMAREQGSVLADLKTRWLEKSYRLATQAAEKDEV